MSEIIVPKWEDLQKIVSAANSNLTICCPYYSDSGVGKVFDSLEGDATLTFLTKLSPSDWVNHVSDPESLLTLLELLKEGGREVELRILQRLHAKIYLADSDLALIGSANLSEGGFGKNLEMMVLLKNAGAKEVRKVFESTFYSESRLLEIGQLSAWVNDYSKTIKTTRSKKEGQEAEELKEAQKALDKLLGFGKGTYKIQEPGHSEFENFVNGLRKNIDLPGARILLVRHDNSDGQNLTGHFRQCFYAVMRFLQEYPNLRPILSKEFKKLGEKDIYQLSSQVSQNWIDHVDAHALDNGPEYDYSILRNILPPNLGGTRLGGGGGMSTLKRMLPLIANFIEGHIK